MKKILGATIGNCVHVDGLHHFIKLAEEEGYHASLLGPSVSIGCIVDAIRQEKPDIMALSYWLNPEIAANLFHELAQSLNTDDFTQTKLIFGGTPNVTAVAKKHAIFDRTFDGSEHESDIRSYFKGSSQHTVKTNDSRNLSGRIILNYPLPIIHHHFGNPTMAETLAGIKELAKSEVVDVITFSPDQYARKHFFESAEIEPEKTDAGGVPIRSEKDMMALYEASRYGNFPLLRCDASTRDRLKWANMSVKTIINAWAVVPFCLYDDADMRSNRTIEETIAENQRAMRWHARHHVPVEVNESHQWSLREAHDSLAVAMFFLAAYNAKKMGVRNFIAHFVFNNPLGTLPSMDLAKMLAKLEMISELEDKSFTVYREVNVDVAHTSSMPSIEKRQFSDSLSTGMALNPHILHVVGHGGDDNVTLPGEIIERCQIARSALNNYQRTIPDMAADLEILSRKGQLVYEAKTLLESFKFLGEDSEDPMSDPYVIASAIREGIFDAPLFQGNPTLRGSIVTGLVNGSWQAFDPSTGELVEEEARIMRIFNRIKQY